MSGETPSIPKSTPSFTQTKGRSKNEVRLVFSPPASTRHPLFLPFLTISPVNHPCFGKANYLASGLGNPLSTLLLRFCFVYLLFGKNWAGCLIPLRWLLGMSLRSLRLYWCFSVSAVCVLMCMQERACACFSQCPVSSLSRLKQINSNHRNHSSRRSERKLIQTPALFPFIHKLYCIWNMRNNTLT